MSSGDNSVTIWAISLVSAGLNRTETGLLRLSWVVSFVVNDKSSLRDVFGENVSN